MDVVRHFTNLSRLNFGVDVGPYPLGSYTMKYNPKFNEDLARLPGFVELHPLLPQLRRGGLLTQGALVLKDMDLLLNVIAGVAPSLCNPWTGCTVTGIMLMAAYHRRQDNAKSIVLVSDSVHGTNSASAAIAGY